MTKTIVSFKLLCSGILILLYLPCYSQQSEVEMVRKIQSFQIVEDQFYDSGLFPSKRTWSFSSKPVEDNTIFFTASIVSTLQMVHAKLDSKSRKMVDSMISNADQLYPKYKNRGGGVTYSFWQTVAPDLPFPNGSKLISNERLRLPDDFDTSILIALAQEKNDSADLLLRNRMVGYSSRENREDVKLFTPQEYQDVKAYETWFGKDMPQAFDLSVMSNVLLYVMRQGFVWNAYDSATASLINTMILNDDHRLRTSDVSFHSTSPALILYHVARLIAVDNIGHFDEAKAKVLGDLVSLLDVVENEVEKVMILSSLHRLGYEPSASIDFDKLKADVKTFSFFSVNPFNMSKGESRYLPSVRWVSEAYNWTLMLELLLLEKE
ncbi:MAG: hypothetical protein ABJG47_06070 [Ekhidna sp.]